MCLIAPINSRTPQKKTPRKTRLTVQATGSHISISNLPSTIGIRNPPPYPDPKREAPRPEPSIPCTITTTTTTTTYAAPPPQWGYTYISPSPTHQYSRERRSSLLDQISFVEELRGKLAPPLPRRPPLPMREDEESGPSKTEKRLLEGVAELKGKWAERETREQVAEMVERAKAEGIKEGREIYGGVQKIADTVRRWDGRTADVDYEHDLDRARSGRYRRGYY